MPLIEFTDKGLYCPQGAFYVDPWRPVGSAVITHAHSDHARAGCSSYLCHRLTRPLLELRLGPLSYESIEWGQPVYRNGVRISLHPAGHIIGSSQVRVEFQGEVWVVSGDYKLENDGLSGSFEPVPCHSFITESTFGLPIYDWKPQSEIFASIRNWVSGNREEGKSSILIAYSLGKAQRLLSCLKEATDMIFVHGAIWNVHQALVRAGVRLPPVHWVTAETPKDILKGAVVIAPSGAEESPWIRRFSPYEVGVCSGWMQVRGNFRRRNVNAGFALSDHADWKGLLQAIGATGARKVFVTHGFQAALSRYLNEKGVESGEVKTEFGEDEDAGGSLPAEDAAKKEGGHG
ncbi:MAG: ligase-associated DNA damage response exonuclease [Bacteroidota bacterium]|nr:ligase-associated DNA damage response exonuclease [Bacteroidota bacterium]MDP4217249.1 ligase-associated DNA damage response exonuclease [Bacteroidota bacterium]MDP4244920.1 ligase-associated DNA damage response exonuclease [Bacteroidota bacterium]MDP4255944.1 ligase-associated DNA damage response exonuclease [Bacteroidota bacterium]MDP4257580.1 ligase-associated DNA damage response exonuclease [Bacteroidota bacterium]